MTSATDLLIIVGIVGGSLVLGLGIVFAILRVWVGRFRARVQAQFPADGIVMAEWFANNFGVQSRGVTQLRGNGALVLGKDALHFVMMATKNELKIPLASITAVSFAKSHLGKTVGRKLLAIDFTNEAGAADRVALLVRQPEAWQQALQGSARRAGV
jgi:hypothetical protein